MKRNHELGSGRAAMAGLNSLYASASNESHRKPGSGHGEAKRRRRSIEAQSTTPPREGQVRDNRAEERKPAPEMGNDERQTPAVYRKPVRRY